MGKLILVTGGQRSGKSSLAQKMAEEKSQKPIFLATSRIWDKDHARRIRRHKQDRPDNWITLEEEKYFSKHGFNNQIVVIDCITLWLTNFFYDNKQDIDKSLQEAEREIDYLTQQNAEFIIVSNELGMGAHPNSLTQMRFNDLQGWTNQYIAKKAEAVYLMISGISTKIK